MPVKPEKPLCSIQRRVRIKIIAMGFRTTRDFAKALAKSESEYMPYHRDYWWRGLSIKSKATQLIKAAELLGTSLEVLLGKDVDSTGAAPGIFRVNLNE